MKIEINAIVQGRPAFSVIELPEVKWMFAEPNVKCPANVLPASIHRIDLEDEQGNRVTLR